MTRRISKLHCIQRYSHWLSWKGCFEDSATILHGVSIGDFSIIAADTVVTKDRPSRVLVVGNPTV